MLETMKQIDRSARLISPYEGLGTPPPGSRWTAVRLVVLLTLGPALGVAPMALPAQEAPAVGTLVGRVVDASTGEPVANTLVTLEPATPGLMVEGRAALTLTNARSVVTGTAGTYSFRDVAPGRYRLRLERLGYRGTSVEVDVRHPGQAFLAVGLDLDPVALEPVRARTRSASIFQRTANPAGDSDAALLDAERDRQELFLTPDARVMTYSDVVDGVTLGEADVFRALQRLPGVGTRDDYSAEIWTRGAPWTHTRVTFDGVPLFNPLHLLGILSAVTPDVLGAVFYHPGVRPAGVAEGIAGAVDLRSRRGGGSGEVRGAADVSFATAKLALEQSIDDRGAWLVVARHSHLQLLSNGLNRAGMASLDLPFRFFDLTGRIDVEPGAHTRIEASGLWEEDRLTGDLQGVLERTQAAWGNRAGQVTVHRTFGELELSHTLALSRFRTRTESHQVRTREQVPSWRVPPREERPAGRDTVRLEDVALAWTEPASQNEIEYARFSGQLAPTGRTGIGTWTVGYDAIRYGGRYVGPLPRYHAVKPDTIISSLRRERSLALGALWAETRVAAGDRLQFSPGVRIEFGNDAGVSDAVRISPRLAARFRLSADQSVSFAAGRSWQYVQAIGLAGPSIHPAFHASHFWFWAGERWGELTSPAVRTDVASIGTERWLGRGWLASSSAYLRRASGLTVPDPEPGQLAGRPIFVLGENTAHGADLYLRRIGARWSASGGYAWGVSNVEAAGHRFPSPAERRHMADLMLGARLGRSVRVAGVYSAMSGAPFTRAYPLSRQECTAFGFGCSSPAGSYVQSASAERTPRYESVDALIQWSGSVLGSTVSAYLQVRNVTDRDNASTYGGSLIRGRVPVEGTRDEWRFVWDDRFEPGLPRLPLVGVRVAF